MQLNKHTVGVFERITITTNFDPQTKHWIQTTINDRYKLHATKGFRRDLHSRDTVHLETYPGGPQFRQYDVFERTRPQKTANQSFEHLITDSSIAAHAWGRKQLHARIVALQTAGQATEAAALVEILQRRGKARYGRR